jgi:hypothetical protein
MMEARGAVRNESVTLNVTMTIEEAQAFKAIYAADYWCTDRVDLPRDQVRTADRVLMMITAALPV